MLAVRGGGDRFVWGLRPCWVSSQLNTQPLKPLEEKLAHNLRILV